MSTSILSQPTSHEGRPRKTLGIALWAVQIGLSLMFLLAGAGKLTGAPAMVGLFQAIGIGQWFRYVTGTLEVLGAVLLLVPGASAPGAALLISVMLGAVTTHLVILHNSPSMPLALLAGLSFVAWGHRAQLASFARRVARGL